MRRRTWRPWAGALAWYLATIFVLVTLNFLLPRAMPGNPVDALLAQGSSGFVYGEDARAKLQEYYGLDRPLAAQYGHYLAGLTHGDLGRSIITNKPVKHEIARRLPWTILLVGGSMLLSTVIGLVAGIHSGWRRDRPADRAVMTGLLAVYNFPPYLLASILLFLVGVKLHWVEPFGAETPFSSSFGLVDRVLDIAQHAALPILVLTAGITAYAYLLMRGGMVRELGSDYLVLGRAKGLRQRRLKYRYAARNALLPVATNIVLDLGVAVFANVLVERVFSYPGLGGLMFDSLAARDYPSIQGVFLVLSVGIVTANALADASYRRLDPRTAA